MLDTRRQQFLKVSITIALLVWIGTDIAAIAGVISPDLPINFGSTDKDEADRTLLFLVGIAFVILVLGGLRLRPAFDWLSKIEIHHWSRYRHYEHNILVGRDGGVRFPRKGELAVQPQEHRRIIDVNLLADRFVPGAEATLTVTIRLLRSAASGQWQGHAKVDPGMGPVQVMVSGRGFEMICEPPAPIDVPTDRDTKAVPFVLRILEANEHWLNVMLTQAGRPIGDLTIEDFSTIGTGRVQHTITTPVYTIKQADLTLRIEPANDKGDVLIRTCSPSDRVNMSEISIQGFKPPPESLTNKLRDQIKALYKNQADPDETETKLKKVGADLAELLPDRIVTLLRRPDIRCVILKHEVDFEFPIELCYLDDDTSYSGNWVMTV